MSSSSVSNQPLRTGGVDRFRYLVRFNVNAGADPDPLLTVSTGNCATVTRTAAGTYRVRFIAGAGLNTSLGNNAFIRYKGCELGFEAATPNRAMTGSVASNADGTVDFVVITVDGAGAALDIAANNARQVTFWVEADQLV